jgi:hypothetical protein
VYQEWRREAEERAPHDPEVAAKLKQLDQRLAQLGSEPSSAFVDARRAGTVERRLSHVLADPDHRWRGSGAVLVVAAPRCRPGLPTGIITGLGRVGNTAPAGWDGAAD